MTFVSLTLIPLLLPIVPTDVIFMKFSILAKTSTTDLKSRVGKYSRIYEETFNQNHVKVLIISYPAFIVFIIFDEVSNYKANIGSWK